MISVTFVVFGIVVLIIIGGAGGVLIIAARAPEGFEDEQGFHYSAEPPLHPST